MSTIATMSTLSHMRRELAVRGVQRHGREVPFGITMQELDLPPGTAARVRSIGNVVGAFLAGVNDLVFQPEFAHLHQTIPELRLLQRPETLALRDIAPAQLPALFRLDDQIETE